MDSLYWLDYDVLSHGGKLSMALNQRFDANELTRGSNGIRPYFVPDGCVVCHGITKKAPLVNYLDTDEWFDRIENDCRFRKLNGEQCYTALKLWQKCDKSSKPLSKAIAVMDLSVVVSNLTA